MNNRMTVVSDTRDKLMRCKEVLSGLTPEYFLGAGLQFVSLVARQVLLESIETGKNPLGWLGNIEDSTWIFKHRRDVDGLYEYCA